MEIKETDAGTLWCSEVQIAILSDGNVVTNRGFRNTTGEDFQCLGSRCAKWQWTDEDQTKGECGLTRA